MRASTSTGRAGVDATPTRKGRAMKRAQQLEATEDAVALFNVFEENVSAADAYMIIDSSPLRRGWVRSKLALRT